MGMIESRRLCGTHAVHIDPNNVRQVTTEANTLEAAETQFTERSVRVKPPFPSTQYLLLS